MFDVATLAKAWIISETGIPAVWQRQKFPPFGNGSYGNSRRLATAAPL